MNPRTHLLAGVFALMSSALAPLAQAQVIKALDFNDVAGTALTGAAVTGSAPGNFATNIAGVVTDGSGALSFGYVGTPTIGTASYTYASVGAFAPNGGETFRFSVTFGGWNLPNGATQLQTAYVALRSTNSQTSSLVADFTILGGATTTVRYRDSNLTNNIITGGANTRTTPLTLDLTIYRPAGAANDTYDLSYTDNGITTSVITGASMGANSQLRSISYLSIGASGDFATGGGGLTIDSVSFSQIPEPSTYAALAGLGVLALATLRGGRARSRAD